MYEGFIQSTKEVKDDSPQLRKSYITAKRQIVNKSYIVHQ